jgi:hypothetical protein
MTMQLAAGPFGQKEDPGPSGPGTQVIAFLGTDQVRPELARDTTR